jgi:hypothetical protein
MPHIPGHVDKPTAMGVLTSPNDLDLGMQEFLASLGPHPDPNYAPPSAATVGDIKANWVENQFPANVVTGGYLTPDAAALQRNASQQLPNNAAGWEQLIAAQKAGTDLSALIYGPNDFGAPPASPTLGGAVQTAQEHLMTTAQPARPASEIDDWTGLGGNQTWRSDFKYTTPGTQIEQDLIDIVGASAGEAERYIAGLQARGDDVSATRAAELYAETNGIDLFDPLYDPSAPMFDAAGEMTPAASYGEMSTTEQAEFQAWYNSPAVQEHYSTRTGFGEADPMIFKDFRAVQHFVSTLPSAEEVKEQAKKDVTQAEVDAYLKELDAMSDEEYNQIAKNLGLSPATYKTDGVTADKKFLEEGNIRAHETGLGFGFDPSADPFSTFSIDHDLILEQVAAAKLEAAATATGDGDGDGDGDGEEDVSIDVQIDEIFAGLVTQPQHAAIRERMAELGTTDLTQAIRNEFATITTPDYSADILQRYDEMGTALSDAAAERTRVLEETTERAEGRIGEIKTGLKSELEEFETGRVEQQAAVEQGVIDRTTKMEADLTDRLDDIRVALGDQVTSEFEEVAALAGTLTSSQATSSRDAISRLTQIGNMAAAARLSAPAEMSAEALTALSDLQFKVTNEIAQGLADSQAQVKMQKASALLQETMRRGEFETEKQKALVESVLQETLRGTVYEDRTKEMLAQALMQEDQYVRQFNEGVDRAQADAQLQNLFGTQEYERQLDMMNLTRQWQTADALQGRMWQTDDMITARGWQTDDYTKALADQRADTLTAREWQQSDLEAQLARELAGQPDPSLVLNKMRAEFPGVPDSLYSIAMHIKDMDFNPPMAEARVEGPDWVEPDGFRGKYEPIGGANPGWLVTEQIGDAPGESYLRSLGEGVILSYDELTGAEKRRSPQLSAEDYGSLRAMVDFALGLDSQSDLMAELTGMSDEELQQWFMLQGVGDVTQWNPAAPVAGTFAGSSAANTGTSIMETTIPYGSMIAGKQPNWISNPQIMLADLLAGLFR